MDIPREKLLQWVKDLEQSVDQFVDQLKKDLGSSNAPSSRGLGDRIKNWGANVWYGKYNQKNPYFHRNMFGDKLGAKAEQTLYPLYAYKIMNEWAMELEENLNESTGQINLMVQIDNWAKKFKDYLRQKISELVGSKASSYPSVHSLFGNYKKPSFDQPSQTPSQPEPEKQGEPSKFDPDALSSFSHDTASGVLPNSTSSHDVVNAQEPEIPEEEPITPQEMPQISSPEAMMKKSMAVRKGQLTRKVKALADKDKTPEFQAVLKNFAQKIKKGKELDEVEQSINALTHEIEGGVLKPATPEQVAHDEQVWKKHFEEEQANQGHFANNPEPPMD